MDIKETKIIRWKENKLWNSMELEEEHVKMIDVVVGWLCENVEKVTKESFGVEERENGDLVIENVEEFYEIDEDDSFLTDEYIEFKRVNKDLYIEDVEEERLRQEEEERNKEDEDTTEDLMEKLAEALSSNDGGVFEKKKRRKRRTAKASSSDDEGNENDGFNDDDFPYC